MIAMVRGFRKRAAWPRPGCSMANTDVGADQQRLTRVNVQHAVILDVAAAAHHNPVVVGAQYAAKPNTGFGGELHRTDEGG